MTEGTYKLARPDWGGPSLEPATRDARDSLCGYWYGTGHAGTMDTPDGLVTVNPYPG